MATKKKTKGKTVGKRGGAGVAAIEALRGGDGNDAELSELGSGTENQPEPPPEAGEKKPTKMPGETDSFRQVLQMMDAAPEGQLDAIVDYCSQRDLRNLPHLDNDLWDMGVTNVARRRRVITYWARSMGLSMDPNLIQHYRTLEPGSQPEVDVTPGTAKGQLRRYYIEEDSAGNPKMRMSRPGEAAMSLKEANEAIRELRQQHGKEGEQVIIFNEALGRHVPNTASDWVKNNLTAAWSTAREYDRAMAQSGAEPPDPLDVMIDQMGKVEALKGVMGAGATGGGEKPQSDMLQLVEALVKLNDLTGGKRGSGWMDDPVQFMNAMKGIFPEKAEDPAITVLREQNQTLMTKVGDLQNQIIQSQFDALKEQNAALANAINDLRNRPAPGDPTPMTIMKEGMEKVAAEAKGVRQDIKDLGKDLILSGPSDAAGVVKKAIGNTAKLEALTDELIELTE